MSAFLDISAAIRDALLAAPAVAGGHVVRGSKGPMPQEWQEMVSVRTTRTAAEESALLTAPLDWTSEFEVEVQARGSATVDAEAAVDAVLTAVFARLAVLQLDALAVQRLIVEPDIEWETAAADTEVGSARLSVRVIHRTPADSINAWS